MLCIKLSICKDITKGFILVATTVQTVAHKQNCNKLRIGRSTHLPGVFALYCEHGKVLKCLIIYEELCNV